MCRRWNGALPAIAIDARVRCRERWPAAVIRVAFDSRE
jgi:hypothetical protein